MNKCDICGKETRNKCGASDVSVCDKCKDETKNYPVFLFVFLILFWCALSW